MLKNPELNYRQLQQVSNYLFGVSSAYQNIAYYLSTIMTFDWMVLPNDMTTNKTTMLNRLEMSAKKVHDSNPKTIFPVPEQVLHLSTRQFSTQLVHIRRR